MKRGEAVYEGFSLLPKTEPSVEVFDDMFRVNLYRNAKENGEVENFGVNSEIGNIHLKMDRN